MELSELERRRIYDLLCEKTQFGIYSMGRFSGFFSDAEIKAKDYGMKKLKDLLGAMTECIQLLPEDRKGIKAPVCFFPWGETPTIAEEEAVSLECVVEALRKEMPVGEPVKYRRVYAMLKRAGVAPEEYGFKKPSELLKQLSDVVEITHDAGGDLYYTLLAPVEEPTPVEEAEPAAPEVEEQPAPEPQEEKAPVVVRVASKSKKKKPQEAPEATPEITAAKELSPEAVEQLHGLVLRKYEKPGAVINARECDEYLKGEGMGSAQFGFEKPFHFLKRLPFLRTQKRQGKKGVYYTEYVLEEYPPKPAEEPKPEPVKPEPEPQPEPKPEPEKPAAPNHWLCPPENGILNRLCEHTGLDRTKLWSLIVEDYKQALAASAPRKGRYGNFCPYSFPLRFGGVDGGCVRILAKTDDSKAPNGTVHWQVSEIDYYALAETKPFDRLGRFAHLGDEEVQWNGLSLMAQPEQWMTSSGSGKWKLTILNSYITCRFNRLYLQDRIAYTADGQMAAFHTGLMDQHYHDIYACFSRNTKANAQKWNLDGFCVPGAGKLGKRLVMDFNPLPQAASFIRTLDDLYFDSKKPMFIDDHHILVDHIERLPLRFLQDTCRANANAMEHVVALGESMPYEQRMQIYDKLRKVVEQSPELYNTMMQKLSAAADVARHQVSRDYKIGIPSYYVSKNNMNLLLPLSFRNDGVVDNALELELTTSGSYIGHSILTIEQAYMDARQISASTGSWLQEALRR